MPSVLESKYALPERPYSQKELQKMRSDLYNRLRIGDLRASHSKCRHFYNVRRRGQKERRMQESEMRDCGNCSVCHQLRQTPEYLWDAARGLAREFEDRFYEYPERLTHSLIDLESVFYTWLYGEN
jgi:hypothetical protein